EETADVVADVGQADRRTRGRGVGGLERQGLPVRLRVAGERDRAAALTPRTGGRDGAVVRHRPADAAQREAAQAAVLAVTAVQLVGPGVRGETGHRGGTVVAAVVQPPLAHTLPVERIVQPLPG